MSRTDVGYRAATEADIGALRLMHRASLGSLGAKHYSPRQIAGLFLSSETVEPALIGDGTYFVAESAGRIVGSGGWTLRRPAYEARLGSRGALPAETATIRGVFVAPERARQGIARGIMDIVESDAVVRGGAVRLELLSTLAGIDFYGSLGYLPGPRVELPLVNGRTFPAVRMVKQILAEAPLAMAA